MPVAVVAVGGIHVLPQPHARIGDACPFRAQRTSQRCQRLAGKPIDLVLEAQRLAVGAQAAAAEPCREQPVVVVSRHQHHLGARGQCLGQLGQDRTGLSQGLAHRSVSELHHVAEQHQPVHAGQLIQQPRPRSRIAQHVAAATGPQVEI